MEFVYSGKLSLINLTIWIILVLTFKNYNSLKTNSNSYWRTFLFFCVVLFCTFGYSEADTYHYIPIYEKMVSSGKRIHVEDFYFWLTQVLPHNYYLWRFTIWGSAFYIFLMLTKRLQLDPKVLGLAFAVILLQQFVVSRASFGICIFLVSLTLFYESSSQNRYLPKVAGLLALLAAFQLHRSLPIFIFIALGMLVPLKKKYFVISLVLFPFIRHLIVPFVEGLFTTSLFSEQTENFANSFISSAKAEINIYGIIPEVLSYSSRTLIVYSLVKEITFKNSVPLVIRKLTEFVYVLFYVAILFYGQNVSSFVTARTIHFMCFPLTLVLTYYLSNNYKVPKSLTYGIYLMILYDLYRFSYTIWKNW